MFDLENLTQRYCFIAGVDEAGRGPLAGPVVAAAVILDPARPVAGLADSKKLSAGRREQCAEIIQGSAIAWAISEADVGEIDTINILQASLLAMSRALDALTTLPDYVLVDGPHCPRADYEMQAVIKGDSQVAAISAASILAKVHRDNLMLQLDEQYPGYGLARHKGYPTPEHLQALQKLGASPAHRRSFAPVQKVCGIH